MKRNASDRRVANGLHTRRVGMTAGRIAEALGRSKAQVGIVAVAEVFDALPHERPYKKAWSVSMALTEKEAQSGRQFDAAVVKAFLTLPRQERV